MKKFWLEKVLAGTSFGWKQFARSRAETHWGDTHTIEVQHFS